MKDNAIELAKKLKALAEKGVGGEKTNAQMMLEKYMRKYNISEADLSEEKKEEHRFYAEKEYWQFLKQIVYSVCGLIDTYRIIGDKKKEKTLVLECTKAEAIEIAAKFDFFLPKYKKEQKTFYSAFIQVNELYTKQDPDEEKKEREYTEEELEQLKEIIKLAAAMKKNTFRKQIGNGK